MKPRRILYVTRIVRGGTAVVVDQLARGLDRDRYEPIVLFDTHRQSLIREKLSSSDIETIDFKKCLDELGTVAKLQKRKDIGSWIESHLGKWANQSYFSLKSFYKFMLKQVPNINSFVKTIRENRIDIVHTHNDLRHGKPEIIASWIVGVPCICHNHRYTKLITFDRIFARFVASLIYVSRHQCEYYIAQGIPSSKTAIVHNAVNLAEFTREYDTAAIRKEFDIKHNERLIGLIGRIDWWKGHEYFLEAMAEVVQHTSDVKGMIIGQLSMASIDRNLQYFTSLKSIVKSLCLEDKIIFTGFRGDIPRFVSALDVVVHASSTPEPFGLVVIEGMAAGKPVVATAAGGVLDIITDEMNGLLVPCKDATAMAKAILRILSNRDEAEQMGLSARRLVTQKFTVQHHVAAVEIVYDFVVGQASTAK
jgi:glycosyltransferase involved in cell wall biosynthesis